MSLVPRAFSAFKYFLNTSFLFTKSDIKTTVIPVSALAAASAPLSNPSRLLHVIFWVWFHVLQFDVSNQTLDPDEDEKNKSDRPLPSRRMSLRQALRFRWLLVPACWTLSALYSTETVHSSIALVTLTVVYNELAAHRGHWMVRNLVNALGFASFETGATLIAGHSAHKLDSIATLSILISTCIFATTIHAQDFKDEDGDRSIGRKTIPIVFSQYSRYTVIVPLLLWSVGLSVLWQLSGIVSIMLTMLGVFIGVQYIAAGSVEDYQVAFYWYNVWLSVAHMLPAYFRTYL